MTELDSLAIARDEKLLGLEASEDDRNVVDFGNNLQEKFSPVSDHVQRSIGVVE
jgi:hypothetical protein